MNYIDFHTHLDKYSDEEALLESLKTYKGTIVSASMEVNSFLKTKAIAEKACALNPDLRIIPTLGIHPKCAATATVGCSKSNRTIYNDYLNLCKDSPIIGEIGMDFCWYKEAAPDCQEAVLRHFLEYCNKEKKYCVIHTKDAEQRIADILKEYPDVKPVIHWYDGPENVYREFINRGYFQTFGCQVCRSENIQRLLKITPRNLILAETDNPDSEPWLGGTDNSVHLIKRVYRDIAKVLSVSEEEICEIINANSEKIINYSLSL